MGKKDKRRERNPNMVPLGVRRRSVVVEEERPKVKEKEKSKRNWTKTPTTEKLQLSTSSGINEEFAHLPMEKLLALREKLGDRLYAKAILKHSTDEGTKEKSTKKSFKRDNAKRPRETSSKAPDTSGLERLRVSLGMSSTKERRDPRFDPRCGEYDERVFRQTYNFLDDVKASERRTLQEALDEAYENEDFEKVARLKHELKVMRDQELNAATIEQEREQRRALRRENVARMRQGLAPKFIPRAQMKQRTLDAKFERMREKGTIDKYMKRREKRLRAKAARRDIERDDRPRRLKE